MGESWSQQLRWLQRKVRNQARAQGIHMKKESTRAKELEQLVRDMQRMRSDAESKGDSIAASRLATVEANAQKVLQLMHDQAERRAQKVKPDVDAGDHARVMARVLAALDSHPEALVAVREALAQSEH